MVNAFVVFATQSVEDATKSAVAVVLVIFSVSPVTPLVAEAVGACGEPFIVNVVVLPQDTATLFGFIVHDLLEGAV